MALVCFEEPNVPKVSPHEVHEARAQFGPGSIFFGGGHDLDLHTQIKVTGSSDFE